MRDYDLWHRDFGDQLLSNSKGAEYTTEDPSHNKSAAKHTIEESQPNLTKDAIHRAYAAHHERDGKRASPKATYNTQAKVTGEHDKADNR